MQIKEGAQQLTRLWRANATKSPAAPSNHSNLAEPTEKEMLAAGWMPTEDTQEPVEYPDPYDDAVKLELRSEEHTSELQSLMRISYAVFCLKTKNTKSLAETNYE